MTVPFLKTIADALNKLSQTGTKIFYIHGNRDFLIGKRYAKQSSMILLPEDLYDRSYTVNMSLSCTAIPYVLAI